MRLPCTPLTSIGRIGCPSKTKRSDSHTSVRGCGATASWNSSVVAAAISTSISAPTSRLIARYCARRRGFASGASVSSTKAQPAALVQRSANWCRGPPTGAGWWCSSSSEWRRSVSPNGWSTSSGAYGECVERALDLGRAPGSVAGAIGELDDDPSVCEGVDVSACIPGRDAQFTLEHLRVEHRLFDQQVRNPVNCRVAAGSDL